MKSFKYLSGSVLLLMSLALCECKSGRIQEESQRLEMEANREGRGPDQILVFNKGNPHKPPTFLRWAE